MKVELQLQGPLKRYNRNTDLLTMFVDAETCTVRNLLEQLRIPVASVSFISVNDDKESLDFIVKGGEKIVVYPRIAGG
ncbi:MAG TPA: hypothetical protein VLH18_01010 [Candidatus Limnocylindrales bacterium]|nr:hypothetical protein [Candidatus Limnocylindrales bacterium]